MMASMQNFPYTSKDTQKSGTELPDIDFRLPPTPPSTQANSDISEIPSTRNSRSNSVALPLYTLPPPTNSPLGVLKEDIKTPDNHVRRDPRLIRLTGIHPFNVEPPLSALYDEGFLTSPELFYVRNHGAVPEVHDADIPDWEFSIEGHVKHPIKLTLKDLIREYKQITVPITLVCAGNRRKEQNQVRKSKGFSWGAAGLSTALWTGVPMSELIQKAIPKRGARYVCMEGADKLPNGYYGTSVKLNWVMDPNRGIMLAHKMNGETLSPDHGKPLRAVVPGQIGGRSVKWLKRIIVTTEPSDNWYHIYDNRVLPTTVSPEQSASEPKWWMDERYAIYDLNTNSAIAYPAHDEQLCLKEASEIYRAKGYAYGGGGRRVTRVEVTLDKGKSWMLADIKYHEDEYRDYADEDETLFGGKLDMGWRETCFCWCFWEIDIPVELLKDANDVMVRAMDESMHVQPRDMYWSVLGMMNNPWFRVTIAKEGDFLRFEHPTQPALIPGGWMERVKKNGGNLSNGFWGEKVEGDEKSDVVEEVKEIKMTRDSLNKEISLDDLRKHDGATEPWFVLNGEVYDGTSFLEGHPGGATSIIGAAGQDATDEFMAIHSETAKSMMIDYHIGTLDSVSQKALEDGGEAAPSKVTEPRDVFLQTKSWTKAKLTQKKIISKDTRIFTFTLDHENQKIGLPTGQHLMLRLRDPVTSEVIIRSYTPLSDCNTRGKLDILIKVYFDTLERKGGKMTTALEAIPLGNSVEFKGPIGKLEYLGGGRCGINSKIRTVKNFLMICGGSGVTPIWQVLRAVLTDKEDRTNCLVLNGNREESDILCREEMDALAESEAERFRIVHTLTKGGETWNGRRGRVGKELLEKEVGMCKGDGETMVLICGPEGLEKSAHKELQALGWRDDDILFF